MPQHLLDVRVPHVVFPQEALVGEAVHAQGRVDTIGADVAFVNVLACLMHQPPTGAGLGCVPNQAVSIIVVSRSICVTEGRRLLSSQ